MSAHERQHCNSGTTLTSDIVTAFRDETEMDLTSCGAIKAWEVQGAVWMRTPQR
jgi:hypothetical protein